MTFKELRPLKGNPHSRRFQGPLASLLTALAMGLAAWPVAAAVKHWQGDVSGNWNTAGNWLENAVPVNGDQLEFSAATRYTITNDMTGLRMDRITFTDGGYVVRGNGITVTNGLVSAPAAPATGNELQMDLTLGASQTFRCDRTNLYFAGQISLGANTLTVTNPAGTEVIIGAWAGTGLISGTGGITKDGAGTLNFAGWSVANTYSGPTYVKNGTLLLGRTSVPSVPGPGILTIGDGSGAAGSAVVRYASADQIGSVPITVNADGLLDLAGYGDTIDGGLTLNGGDVRLGAATLTLGGNVSVLSSDSVINGPSGGLNLAATRTFDVAPGVMFDLQAPVTGAGGITKTGNGILRPGYPNTYAGLTIVQAGFVEMWTATALGASTSGTVVSNGATLQFRAGLAITNEALTLHGPGFPGYGTLRMWQSGTSSWTGPITLATDSVILVDNAAGGIEISGIISGLGGVTKTGGGTLILSGSADNTYSGGTVVKEGILELNKTGDRWAITHGTLRVGDGVGGERADVVRYLGGTDQLNENVPIVITNSGLLELNGHNDTVGPITFSGGKITLGTGTLTLGGNVTVLDSYPVIEGPSGAVSLPATRTFDVKTGVLDIYAPVTGPGGLTKAGGGTMLLYYNDTYSGLTTVQGGYLLVGAAQSLGTTNNGTVVSNNATLSIFNIATVFNEPLTLNGGAYPALLMRGAKTSYWAGPITLNADSAIGSDDPIGSLHVTSAIGGAGGITKSGPGTLVFEGATANTYGGTTRVDSGTLLLGKSGVDQAIPGNLVITGTVRLLGAEQISNNANVTINSSGALYLEYYPEGIAGLNGFGYLELGYSGLDVGYNNGSGTFSGVVAGAPVDEAGLRKVAGNGTITLTGTNTYRGITYANSGTLLVNGYQPQSPVTVGSGGTFGGTGTVGHVTANGRLWPGASPGLLTSSNLTFTGMANYSVELNGNAPGTGYDQIKARGTVSLGSASLNATLGFPSAISNSFTIIDNDGSDAVTVTFAGLTEGATVNVSGTPFRISYIGGSGNDVVLTQLTATQRPLLHIATANATNVVLSWPTNFTGYTLEANTNLTSNTWSGVSPAPVVGGTNNFVTNAASGLQNHYRLRIP